MQAKSLALTAFVLLGLIVAVPTLSSLSAQESAESAQTTTPSRGRLPHYYSDVVTKDQKVKIYEIQKGYETQIDALEAQIQKLEAAMEKEVEAVLTKPQLDRIKELAAEEELRREKNEAAKRAAQKLATEEDS